MSSDPGTHFDRALLDRLLTVYGRKPVQEALMDSSLQCLSLHLATSNREARVITDIRTRAEARGIPVQFHDRRELSRISKNGKQDQGVALDVLCQRFASLEDYLKESPATRPRRLLALDGITNPQNLGMIVRSATAGLIDGIVLPRKGCAALGPLVIKASAGTLFRAPILACQTLPAALADCQRAGATICVLDGRAQQSLFELPATDFSVFVLGNETDGPSQAVTALANRQVAIPMRNDVESLNVAVAASLIAFTPYLER